MPRVDPGTREDVLQRIHHTMRFAATVNMRRQQMVLKLLQIFVRVVQSEVVLGLADVVSPLTQVHLKHSRSDKSKPFTAAKVPCDSPKDPWA